jgi:hypothetical protein
MSLYIEDDAICIVQLQGVAFIEMPKGLRDWAERFVMGCMEFARQENFRSVRLAKAEHLYSYHHPFVFPWLSPQERERAVKRIHESMKSHHDETAVIPGFSSGKDWFTWDNPDFSLSKDARPSQIPSRHRVLTVVF